MRRNTEAVWSFSDDRIHLVGVVVFGEQMVRARGGGVSCPRDPSQITSSPPEGLATRRSMGINGNYFTRERDEWAAGRETSPFVVVAARHGALVVARAQSHVRARTTGKALQLNNRPPVKQFLTPSSSYTCACTSYKTNQKKNGEGRSSCWFLRS